jgi:hypothetical protein
VPKVGETEDQFARLRPHHHRLHDDPGNSRFRAQRPGAGEDIGRRRAYRIGAGQIEHDATDIGFVNDVARHDLEYDGVAMRQDLRGVGNGLFGIGGRESRHHRDLIRGKQLLDLDRIEPLPAVGQRRGDNVPGGLGIRLEFAGHSGRNLRQRLHQFAVPHQMHETAHRVVFGGIIRNSGAAQPIANRLIRADPGRQHRFGRHAMFHAILLHNIGHGIGDHVGARDRGLDVHHQDRIIAGIGQQHLQRRRITRGVGVADDIDRVCMRPCRRQYRIQPGSGRVRNRGGNSTQFNQPVDRQHADAATVGQDREPLARRRFDPPQRLGAVEQLAQIRHPQDAGALECGVVDRIRSGQRTGMGRGGPGALRHAAGFDDDHRLDPGGGARGRHEFVGVLDRFDIEQDRLRLFVQREVVEQVGDIDVELIADRHDSGKADRALSRPVHHAGGDGARLRDQRQISLAGRMRGKARIEIHAGHDDAQTIRADQPHSVFVRRAFGVIRK